MQDQAFDRHDYLTVFDLIINNDRVTAAFEAYGIDVHNNVAALANDLSLTLKIARFAADVTRVKSYAVGA